MTFARGVTALAAAALLLVAGTSCAADGDGPAAAESSAPNSPTTTPDSPSPPSENEVAADAASAMLRQYFATVDLVRQDSSRPATDLHAVASSSQLTAQKNLLKSQRERGLHQVGDTTVVDLNVESVSLDSPATALIDVCWNVSDVDIVDDDGESVVSPDRKDIGWTRFTVTNGKWESEPTDGWRVSGGSDLEKEPCTGS